METNELRRNNLLYSKGSVITVDGIQPYWLWSNDNTSSYIQDFEPILLTEEWLLKFGFQLTHYPGEGTSAVLEGLDVWYQYGFAQFGSTKRISCKYVHQLQNLFYCLCGYELKVID